MKKADEKPHEEGNLVPHFLVMGVLFSVFYCFPYITKTSPCNILQLFTAVINDNFQMKNCDIFLIFAPNIDRGYTLEPPH